MVARKLDTILQGLTPLVHRSEVTWFPDCGESVYMLKSLIKDISNAMADYQVRPLSAHPRLANIYVRLGRDRKRFFSVECTPPQALDTVLGMGKCA